MEKSLWYLIKDFHQRVANYQAWYNLVRVNSHKDDKSPRQIIKELDPKMNHAIARLPPLMLDWLGPDYITKDELSQRGYHVPWFPYNFGSSFFNSPSSRGFNFRIALPR